MRIPEDLAAVAALDLAEVVRSRWLVVLGLLYTGLGALFVLVGLRESMVLGFTGMGRVLFSLCHALVLLLPLVGLAVTAPVVGRAREDGALELLLSQPVRRASYLLAVAGVRILAISLPLVVVLVALGVAGRLFFGQAVPWSFVLCSAAVSVSLLVAFAGLGILVSVGVRQSARVLTYAVVLWLAGVALLDFGLIALLLGWRVEPRVVFVLAALNPVQVARLALLAAAEPELSQLGPVGFYLAHRVGASGLLALGLGWPLAFGGGCLAVALRVFRRGDAV